MIRFALKIALYLSRGYGSKDEKDLQGNQVGTVGGGLVGYFDSLG